MVPATALVSIKEQRKFQAIEKLLGIPVPKAKVPEAFGEVPEYNLKLEQEQQTQGWLQAGQVPKRRQQRTNSRLYRIYHCKHDGYSFYP